MRAKDFIPASKPRNFVAKNQKTAGAGAHKDKKRAEKQGDVKHKQKQFEQGVAEGVPQPGESSGAPKQFGPDAKIQTRQMTVKQLIASVPGLPYYNNVVDDWDAKDYSWGVTKKVIEYATYLKEHPESLSQLPSILVLNGKFEDGAHRVSAIWLLQQRMDPKNPLWADAKLKVQFVKQDVDEDISRRGFLRGAGAVAAGAALGGAAQASEQPDPTKLIARVSMAGDTKEFDLTGRFKGDAKSQLNQASDWLSEFLEARELDFSDFELRYQGKILKTKNTAANLGMLNR